ncbi:MAG: M15 family metallopeptidase [Nocardioidaceae bacterium]
MILRGGVIASRMAQLGWPWGARWSHPDYQHFSSSGS